MDCPVENLAIGYWRPRGSNDCASGWKNNYYEHVVRGGPAGGGFSTCPDLHRFARALLTDALVSPESRELLWTDHFDHGYGYGFRVEDGPAGKIVGHAGGFTGLNANLDIFVDTGFVVAVMTNYHMAADPVAARIKGLVTRVR
jgi:CubicO group peptidase (beta-lactamase class C family)